MTRIRVVVVSLGLCLAACGGGTQQQKSTTGASHDWNWKLGHYVSGDGVVRLVFDRTGAKAKVKLEGSNDIIELTQEDARTRLGGQLFGIRFVAPDGKPVLFVDEGGGITYLRGRDELPMVRDTDASALGQATIAGTPPPAPAKPKEARDVQAEMLSAISVRSKFPKFTLADSANLAKVAEAFDAATPDMFVHATSAGTAWFAPIAYNDQDGGLGFEKEPREGPATESEKNQPLAKYNAWLRADYDWGKTTSEIVKSSYLRIYQREWKYLAPNTPVLVWDVDANKHVVTVVTLNGGRYFDGTVGNSNRPTFEKGVPASTDWPKPIQHNLLFKEHVVEMAKEGLVEKKTADDLASAYKSWDACAQKTFAPAQKEIEGNMTGSTHFYAGQIKTKLTLRKYDEKAKAQCKEFKQVEDVLVQVLAAREKDRLALYEKTKARVLSLGLGK